MNFFVYVIFSNSTKRFYSGQTNDFDLRLERHNLGMVRSTKSGIPWIEIWKTRLASRTEALKLERKIKKRGITRYLSDNKIEYEEC